MDSSLTASGQNDCNKENDDINSSTNQETNCNTNNNSRDESNKPTDVVEPREDSGSKNDESSAFPTAFTISFEDDNNTSKKLSIKDSIRKFAPPKPHTIEKPRQSKSDQHPDNSLASIESAPAGLTKHSSYRKGHSNSSRSSSRRSNSSRHSNISDSAAFLIDKMLNCSPQIDEFHSLQHSSLPPQSGSYKHHHNHNHHKHNIKSPIPHNHNTESSNTERVTHTTDGISDDEIDFSEDKSDNGTYIVGADPESDAARQKIDELFGVVKAAEASVLADSFNKATSSRASMRQSRVAEKKPISKERQEHINRLACRTSSSVSRSSSSSRQDVISSSDRHQSRQRTSSRHSRNSSCDRTPKAHGSSRPRRSASQSSRQSSNREFSDGDTRSSRSSLHNGLEQNNHDNPLSTHPNMKFNRAFALRRARLGLGEPTSVSSSYGGQETDSSFNNLSSSQKRHQINTNTYRASQNPSGSASFSRDDGGRFSLRMKNALPPGRLSSAQNYLSSNKSSQHGTLIDNYINKVSKIGSTSTPQQQELSSPSRAASKIPHHNSSHNSSGMPYQSGDEFESMLSPSKYRLLLNANRLQQQKQREMSDNDLDSFTNRFNYSTATEYDVNNSYSLSENRAGSSMGRRGSALQLGALDSLVISAISSLSLKIRNSVCDVLVKQAKKLSEENETRLIVEEILPQLTVNATNPKSPTSIEEIDQSLYFDLAKTLKNLKKVEQMVDVINLISDQLPNAALNNSTKNFNTFKSGGSSKAIVNKVRSSECITTTEVNSMNNLSPI